MVIRGDKVAEVAEAKVVESERSGEPVGTVVSDESEMIADKDIVESQSEGLSLGSDFGNQSGAPLEGTIPGLTQNETGEEVTATVDETVGL